MKLLPFQVEAAKDLYHNPRWGCFLEMGLGKSIVSTRAARKLSREGKLGSDRILIICPAHLCLNWKHTILDLWPDRTTKTCMIRSFNFLQARKNAKKHPRSLAREWDLVIVDEAQALKDWGSAQTKNFRKYVWPYARRLWLLTGTPATQSGADYHPILSFLMPGQIGPYGKFADTFAYKERKKIWIWTKGAKPKRIQIEVTNYKGFKNEAVLNKLVRQCSTRRTKAEVLPELPKKMYGELYVDVGPCEYDFSEGGAMENCSPLAILGVQKAVAAAEWILECQGPLLIFTWFTVTAEAIQKILRGAGRKYGRITGKESRAKKVQAVEDFQSGKLDNLVCQTKAAGTGWNLQRAETILVIDVPWSWADFEQLSDRANRIGSMNPVRVITCVADGTTDNKVLATLEMKKRGMEAVLDRSVDVDHEIKKIFVEELSGGKHTLRKNRDGNGARLIRASRLSAENSLYSEQEDEDEEWVDPLND